MQISRIRKRRFKASVLLGVALLLSTLAPTTVTRADEPESVETPASELLDLSQWEGKVILLDFWASWCGPCAESFPWMAEMSEKYGERGLVIVGVNLDSERLDADRFLAAHSIPIEHVFDPDGLIADAYGVQTMPTSIIIDRTGKPVARHDGFRPKNMDDYEKNLVAFLSSDTNAIAAYTEGLSAKHNKRRGVRPWNKGILARPEMSFLFDPLDLAIDDHIYFSKEASSGGRGFGGGCCGCN